MSEDTFNALYHAFETNGPHLHITILEISTL